MLFNEYGVYQMMKLRQEEIEKIALNAWKYEDFKKESYLQKLVKKWYSRQKSIAVQQQNCNSACQC